MPSLAVCTWWKSVRKSDFRLLSADVLNFTKTACKQNAYYGACDKPSGSMKAGRKPKVARKSRCICIYNIYIYIQLYINISSYSGILYFCIFAAGHSCKITINSIGFLKSFGHVL